MEMINKLLKYNSFWGFFGLFLFLYFSFFTLVAEKTTNSTSFQHETKIRVSLFNNIS